MSTIITLKVSLALAKSPICRDPGVVSWQGGKRPNAGQYSHQISNELRCKLVKTAVFPNFRWYRKYLFWPAKTDFWPWARKAK